MAIGAEGFDAVVVRVLHQRRRDHVRRRAADEQRVAVGLGLRGRAGGRSAVPAPGRLSTMTGLPRASLIPVRDRAREQIGRGAAGGVTG